MHHALQVYPDLDPVAKAGAEYVASTAHAAVAATGRFHFAVSGGRTPWAMFDYLTNLDLPWKTSVIYQVDERVAPRHDPDRNLSHLLDHLGEAPVEVVPMAVESDDLDAAAEYARRLPTRFDLVHLGLGPDGHTASLVPEDPVLEVTDRLV